MVLTTRFNLVFGKIGILPIAKRLYALLLYLRECFVALQCLGMNSAEKGWCGWAVEGKLVQKIYKVSA